MPGRKVQAGGYRFGFQGQEQDDEVKGDGNSVNYKYRVHDPRLGRFLSIDPLAPEYPFYSPYVFSGNRVIDAVELEGLEPSWFGTTHFEVKAELQAGAATYLGVQAHVHTGIIYDSKGNIGIYSSFGGFYQVGGNYFGTNTITALHEDGLSAPGFLMVMGADSDIGIEFGYSMGIDNVWDYLKTTDWTISESVVDVGISNPTFSNDRNNNGKVDWTDFSFDGIKLGLSPTPGMGFGTSTTETLGLTVFHSSELPQIIDTYEEAQKRSILLQSVPNLGIIPFFEPNKEGDASQYYLKLRSYYVHPGLGTNYEDFNTGVLFERTRKGFESLNVVDSPSK